MGNGSTWREKCERGKAIKQLAFDVVTYPGRCCLAIVHNVSSVHASLRNIYIPADHETQELSSGDSNDSPNEGVKKYGDKSKGPSWGQR